MTAVRILLVLALVASAAIAAYGLLVARSIPIAVAGLLVLGITLAMSGFILGMSALSNGRAGNGWRAWLWAFIGGLFMIAAAGALAGAAIFALLVGTI